MENKCGEESDDFFWFILSENILQNELGKDEFVSRVDLVVSCQYPDV